MARPRKHVTYTASDEVTRRYFAESMSARAEAKTASGLISDLNREMVDAGCHPGVMSYCRRLAAMPEAQRALHIALLHRYLMVLAAELDVVAPSQPRIAA
jgi:hypothetical protein